ncbi:uncharacterized protein LOC121728684 [Aricia agestis]|uniref:uncharacterized protein LOC121728684 n=1 Tax=Aricia agestis TaxID=91739 RepID=UPI001C201AC4|nr:uncharacterized protein LOC121728684 [Aricia agestis]
MVCHRWTLVVILLCIPLLVTVISAFRVRLPGYSHDGKADLKKHKCENCEVNEPNLDQIVNIKRPDIVKHSSENVKRLLSSDTKAKKTPAADKHVTSDTKLGLKSKQEVSNDKNTNIKKPVFVFDFGDDDSEDIDDDDGDELDDGAEKAILKSSDLKSDYIAKLKSSHEHLNKIIIEKKQKEDDENDVDEASVEEDDNNDNDDDEDDDDDDDDDDDNDDENDSKSSLKRDALGDDDDDDGNDNDDDDDEDDDEDDDDDDDDDDEDDEDEDEKEESSYERMIKLIKKRTSEAVKGRSSEDLSDENSKTNNEIEKLKLLIHTSEADLPEKSHSKEKTDKKDTKTLDSKKSKVLLEEKQHKTEKEKKKPMEKSKPETLIDQKSKVKESIDPKKDKPTTLQEKLKPSKKDDEKTLINDKQVKKGDNKKAEEVKLPKKEDKVKLTSNIEKSTKETLEKSKDKKPEGDDKAKVIQKELKIEPKEKPLLIPKTSAEKSSGNERKRRDSQESISNIEKLLKKRETKERDEVKKNEKKSDIQFMTDALRRRNLLQSEFEDMYAFLPSFAPNFSRIHNAECRRHGQILLRQLRGTKLWALNMLDATAKIPSGLLQGNGIQLGDFDQCLGTRARVQLDTGSVVKLQGKYCLAMLDVKANVPELEVPVYLAQGKHLFKSRLDDPGHFVPRFSTLSWGVCVPSPCEPQDVELMLRDAVKHYQKKLGVTIRIKVEEHDCHVKQGDWEDWLELPTIFTLSYYLVVVLIVIVATVQEYLARHSSESSEEEEKDGEKEPEESESKESTDGFFAAFSLYSSINKLIAPANESEIACIHGLRAIATVALLVAHKFLPVAVTPYNNRLKISEIVSSPLLSWCRAGWIFTDCFLLLSGALASYRTSKDDSVIAKVLSKYLRLTPALLAVVLFYAYVWDNISVGPMWGTLVTRNAEICQESWWWNILYAQNYLAFQDMCAPQTHQLALDLQLTVLGGIIIWAIQSEVYLAGAVMPALHLLSGYWRYTTYRDHRLTSLAYQGVSVSQLYRTGTLSYTSTFARCTPYLIGLSLGIMLRKPQKIGKFLLTLGWLVFAVLWGGVLWAGADAGDLQYRYDVTFAAQYATFAPLAAGLSFAWLIYTVHNGYFSILASLLSSRPLLFISRISYGLYLTQFIVFLTNSAIVKTSREFTIISLFDIHEISTILSISIILTILFIIPLQSLPRISFTFKKEDESENQEESEPASETEEKEEESKPEVNNVKEERHTRNSFMAHREILEEIPEADVEYEEQRDVNEGLEGIVEEEEEDVEEEMMERIEDEELEVIEEEEGGEDYWTERDESHGYSRYNQDSEEWEWTDRNDGTGPQRYRYTR